MGIISSAWWQVVWEVHLSGADEGALQDAMLQRLAEKETGYYGKAGIPRPGATSKGAAPGAVSAISMQEFHLYSARIRKPVLGGGGVRLQDVNGDGLGLLCCR